MHSFWWGKEREKGSEGGRQGAKKIDWELYCMKTLALMLQMRHRERVWNRYEMFFYTRPTFRICHHRLFHFMQHSLFGQLFQQIQDIDNFREDFVITKSFFYDEIHTFTESCSKIIKKTRGTFFDDWTMMLIIYINERCYVRKKWKPILLYEGDLVSCLNSKLNGMYAYALLAI